MKAVMLSIKPNWCELIASGKKTVEVRKTKPKLNTPFKCYIYCTKDKSHLVFVDERHEDYTIPHIGNGQVIGEFVCDEIELLDIEQTNCLGKSCKDINTLKENSCLSSYDLLVYLQSKNGYCWHISDLVIYDKPKGLEEFHKLCTDPYRYCQECKHGFVQYPADVETKEDLAGCCFDTACLNRMTQPPQSWCYVEELSI